VKWRETKNRIPKAMRGLSLPIYPIFVQLKTVFPAIGVAVTTAYPLTVEPTYVTAIDVRPAQSLTVNVTYETKTDVRSAQSLSVNVTYTYEVTVT